MTLHGAIAEVLSKHGDEMTTHEIADEIAARGLYKKGDGNSPWPVKFLQGLINALTSSLKFGEPARE